MITDENRKGILFIVFLSVKYLILCVFFVIICILIMRNLSIQLTIYTLCQEMYFGHSRDLESK